MIVEFAGCPGAGKTRLAFEVARYLRGLPLQLHLSPGSSAARTSINVVKAVILAVPVVTATRGSRVALQRVRESMRGRANSYWQLTRTGSAIRRLGHFNLASRKDSRIHLTDEGVLGMLDLGLSGGPRPSDADIKLLIETLPVPDIVVLLRAPVELLIERAATRRDPPREWKALSPNATYDRMSRLDSMFGTLLSVPQFCRALPLRSPANDNELQEAAEAVAREISRNWTGARLPDTSG